MFWNRRSRLKTRRRPPDSTNIRIVLLRIVLVLVLASFAGRLFYIQVMSHDFYSVWASDQQDILEKLFPERGEIYVTDPKAPDGRFPVAVNKTLATLFADTRQLEKKDVPGVAQALVEVLEAVDSEMGTGGSAGKPTPAAATEAEKQAATAAAAAAAEARKAAVAAMVERLSAENDPYVPIRSQLEERVVERIRELDLPGIAFSQQTFRYYPEKQTACHLTGFVGQNEAGERVGRYGIEGHWNDDLSGSQGFLESQRNPSGGLIAAGSHELKPAVDGADVTLTIDRNIQFVACTKLREAVQKHGAAGGAVVIMEPRSGKILALCGMPDFDPNAYSKVPDMSAFNNPAIYYAYEPGSVFKPVTMAAAIDAGKVTPKTTYTDTGQVAIGQYTIRNSDGKANGIQTMTDVLEKSLNTGAIFAVRQLGAEKFRQYVDGFGFGQPTDLGLDGESKGDVSSLTKRGDIWSATASYGQGITVTPVQMAAAYSALANGGKLMKPYVVAEVKYPDGSGFRGEPQELRQVISKRAADLISGMLVRVVEDGHGKQAAVPGYWVAGKTGTAQISDGQGGYEKEQFNGTFVGFAPVDNPAFVMVTKIERPQDVVFAESSAAPLFGGIAAFLLQYLQIPPDRPLR